MFNLPELLNKLVDLVQGVWETLFGCSLPHPREAMNWKAVSIDTVIGAWLDDWEVPLKFRHFWHAVNFELSSARPEPANSFEIYNWETGKFESAKHIIVRPEWASPGVIAHESAHVAYSLFLNQNQKTNFTVVIELVSQKNKLVRRIIKETNWGNVWQERHAEIYRFLGQQMPKELKKYYPKLLEE